VSEHVQWTSEDVRDWMLPAFQWLGEQWEQRPDAVWADLKPGFLAELDLHDESDVPIVRALFEHVEPMDEEARRGLLITDTDRDPVVDALYDAWAAEQQAEPEQPAVEPFWDEATGQWLAWDSDRQEWAPMQHEASAQEIPAEVAPVLENAEARIATEDLAQHLDEVVKQLFEERPELAEVPEELIREWVAQGLTEAMR
jgi:hypothetical protein